MTEDKFYAQVKVMDSGCHEWIGGSRAPGGYGSVRMHGTQKRTHRVAWELVNGKIPDGLCVLHKCDNPPCINVDHLFLGTEKDNATDCVSKGRHVNGSKTHCPRGHEYAGPNLWSSPGQGRKCKTCNNEKQNDRRRRASAAR